MDVLSVVGVWYHYCVCLSVRVVHMVYVYVHIMFVCSMLACVRTYVHVCACVCACVFMCVRMLPLLWVHTVSLQNNTHLHSCHYC